MIKDKNCKYLTEAEEVVRLYRRILQKSLNDPDNHNGVVTHLESYILECEAKQALGSIITNKASRGDGIPAEQFQILKNDAVKVLHSVCKQICQHLAVDKGLEKVSFHSNCKEGNAKECSNYHTIALISHTNKVMLKTLQARFQQELRSSRCKSWV